MAPWKSPSAPATSSPALDLSAACGRHFALRDLIECGETWGRLATEGGIDNLPRQPETLAGLERLCRDLLDPMVDHFGSVQLTYAFASRSLTRRIPRGIAPSLDQHAGYEVTKTGRLVCSRRGQAADVHVPGVGSHVIARWIASETPFDRLYFYGSDRPIHVSVGPDGARNIVWVRRTEGCRTIPRVIDARDLPPV